MIASRSRITSAAKRYEKTSATTAVQKSAGAVWRHVCDEMT